MRTIILQAQHSGIATKTNVVMRECGGVRKFIHLIFFKVPTSSSLLYQVMLVIFAALGSCFGSILMYFSFKVGLGC